MRRSLIQASKFLSGAAFLTTLLFSSNGLADSNGETCQIGEGFTDAISLSDVKFSFTEHEDGYAILVTSANPARKAIIRKMVFELLKEKSLRTHETSEGYGIASH